jgi:hypothetical protein
LTITPRAKSGGAKRRPGAAQAAAKDAEGAAETRAGTGDERDPPASRLRLPLKAIDDVKAELARLYREGKAGRREIADVSRLANVLALLGRLIEGADLEARVAALEDRRKPPIPSPRRA